MGKELHPRGEHYEGLVLELRREGHEGKAPLPDPVPVSRLTSPPRRTNRFELTT